MFLRASLPRHGIPGIVKHILRLKHTGAQKTSPLHPPLMIRIKHGAFYREYPFALDKVDIKGNQVADPRLRIFKRLSFSLPSSIKKPQFWAIVGPSATEILQILRGEHFCWPPYARRYPWLNSRTNSLKGKLPGRAIQYVGFGKNQRDFSGKGGTAGAYLGARYESRREATDFSVLDYLQGNTSLNSYQEDEIRLDCQTLDKVVKDLSLEDLLNMPMLNLSNGQRRRAMIARALLSKPEVLLLDKPFTGLDPPTVKRLSSLLGGLAKAYKSRVVLALKTQDPIPDWTTHLLVLGSDFTVRFQGPKDKVLELSRSHSEEAAKKPGLPAWWQNDHPSRAVQETKIGEPVIEMEGVRVVYGEKTVLGNWQDTASNKTGLWWTVRRGERWGIFGPNGSGKTTALSLICSDHPQTYSLPIKLFGKSRLPTPGEPGISIFDLQARIGHSSPEINNHFPRQLTVRQTLQNAWAETFKGSPVLDDDAEATVTRFLRKFEQELRPDWNVARWSKTNIEGQKLLATGQSVLRKSHETSWADETLFGEVPFSAQKVALFLRAIIKKPDLVILDEAFSGMSSQARDMCLYFLQYGESRDLTAQESKQRLVEAINPLFEGLEDHQALICISHVPAEVPWCVRDWICLPDPASGSPPRVGRLEEPLEAQGDSGAWKEIWGLATSESVKENEK